MQDHLISFKAWPLALAYFSNDRKELLPAKQAKSVFFFHVVRISVFS